MEKEFVYSPKLSPYWVTILWQILLLREEVILSELKTLVCLN